MTLLSTLRILTRNNNLVRECKQIPIRFSGHERKIEIEPSHFTWKTFKDYLHFYFLLGAIPLGLITLYANFRVGEAELTEVPEGYIPHHWEYYKHPITRFLAKHIFNDRAIAYEATVAKLAEKSEIAILHSIKKDLKYMMYEKADNKSWFYTPVDPKFNRYIIDAQHKTYFQTDGIRDEGELNE